MANKAGIVVDDIQDMTHEEVMAGYGALLHMYIVGVRAIGVMLTEEQVITVANVTHELPNYLGRNLKGFSHDWFWGDAESYGVIDELYSWFQSGVQMNRMVSKKE